MSPRSNRPGAPTSAPGREPVRRGRPPIYDHTHFVQVAQTYQAAYAAGLPPTKAVADEFGCSRSAAAKHVQRARHLGLLGLTSRGQAGGLGLPGRPRKGRTGAPRPRPVTNNDSPFTVSLTWSDEGERMECTGIAITGGVITTSAIRRLPIGSLIDAERQRLMAGTTR